jgi:beta-RFAP synthase
MKVKVKTPSRLHLGIIDVNGELGRMFGSIGLAIEQPNTILEFSESTNMVIEGEYQERVKQTTEKILNHFRINKLCQIKVLQTIPSHVGLGSGTQLELATALGLSKLFNFNATVSKLSQIIGRGSVSGIGTASFEMGGFIVDGGKSTDEKRKNKVPPIITRHEFPKDWFIEVALPGIKKGISGKDEGRAFEKLPSAPADLVGKMCRLLVMKMIPALLEHDISGFGSALTDFQKMTGESFSSVQGGKFAGGPVSETVKFLLDEGAHGAGQSSWGPTVYGLVEGKTEAKKLQGEVQNFLDSNFGGYAFYTQADNRGAEVVVEEY